MIVANSEFVQIFACERYSQREKINKAVFTHSVTEQEHTPSDDTVFFCSDAIYRH